MDNLSAATNKTAATLASPISKVKAKVPTGSSAITVITHGCEHLKVLFENSRKPGLAQYTQMIQTLHERPSIICQTTRNAQEGDGRPSPTILPTYLCLQCVAVLPPEARAKHRDAKGHCFFVESKSGYFYCQDCDDFIYDPALEEIRLRKGRKKRKFEQINESDDKLITMNSSFIPCKSTGLRGLYNMGQTCFMSVILQSLVHNPFIRAYYLSEGHKSSDCERESCCSCALDEMLAEFHSIEKTEGYGAVSMLLASWNVAQALAGYQQQDAHEYMQFLFHALHEENGGTPDRPDSDCACVIHQTFYGKLQSTVTCEKCKNVTTRIEPVMDLSLDLRQAKKRKVDGETSNQASPSTDLRDCLERFTGREKLAAADYICQNCNSQQNAIKQLSIKRLPPVIPIHLKRFEHTKSTSTKLETKIRFPMSLDMYPYTTRARTPKNAPPPNPPPTLTYELCSVVVHKGKIDSGHYVGYCRQGSNWFQFDDSKVILASDAEVLDANGYLLTYVVKYLDG